MLPPLFEDLLQIALVYTSAYPKTILAIGGLVLFLLIRRVQTYYRNADQVRREFRRAGIHASAEQEDALRGDFARIAALEACKKLEETLHYQAEIKREQAQLDRVLQLSNAHVAMIRDIGVTLQALEMEYARQRKGLASEQAKEALRLIVESAVTQITEMAATPKTKLPKFVIEEMQNKVKITDKFNSKVNEKVNGRGEPLHSINPS